MGDISPLTCLEFFKMTLTRILILLAIVYLAFLIPNINVMLTLGGSVLGAIISIILPILMYNGAYSDDSSRSRGGDSSSPEQ